MKHETLKTVRVNDLAKKESFYVEAYSRKDAMDYVLAGRFVAEFVSATELLTLAKAGADLTQIKNVYDEPAAEAEAKVESEADQQAEVATEAESA